MSGCKSRMYVFFLFCMGYTNQVVADSLVYEDRLNLKYSVDIRKKMDISFSELDASSTSKVNYKIDRFAGCHGEMKKAKKNLQPAKGNLQEPLYHTRSFDKGILGTNASSNPICVAFDNPQGVVDFQEYTMNLTEYVFSNIWDCVEGCGDEYCVDENGNEVDMTSWESQISSKHREEFQKYEKTRKEEVAEQQKIYETYKSNYEQWERERKKVLPLTQVRYQIQTSQDISKGTIAIYNYTWRSNSWCDDINEVSKGDLRVMFVPIEKVKKDQVIDIWLEGASVGRTWGFVLGSDQNALFEDIQNIQKEAERQRNRILPEYLLNRVGESTLGYDSEELNECCSC